MSPTRLILIALSLVLVVIGLWQYSLSASAPAGSGSMNFWIAIGCVAAAGGALLGFKRRPSSHLRLSALFRRTTLFFLPFAQTGGAAASPFCRRDGLLKKRQPDSAAQEGIRGQFLFNGRGRAMSGMNAILRTQRNNSLIN